MHAWRQFRKFELLGRLHNYAGSAGRRGGSSTADLSTQSRLLALAIGPWAARKGIVKSQSGAISRGQFKCLAGLTIVE